MGIAERDEFLRGNINGIISEVYLEEDVYDWSIVRITHSNDCACVEVKNNIDCERDEDHSLLIFKLTGDAGPAKHLVTYNMMNGVWKLHSYGQGLEPPHTVSQNLAELESFNPDVKNKPRERGFFAKLFSRP